MKKDKKKTIAAATAVLAYIAGEEQAAFDLDSASENLWATYYRPKGRGFKSNVPWRFGRLLRRG